MHVLSHQLSQTVFSSGVASVASGDRDPLVSSICMGTRCGRCTAWPGEGESPVRRPYVRTRLSRRRLGYRGPQVPAPGHADPSRWRHRGVRGQARGVCGTSTTWWLTGPDGPTSTPIRTCRGRERRCRSLTGSP